VGEPKVLVALATEYNPVDGQIFLALLRMLGVNAEAWGSGSANPFPGGWTKVVELWPAFLKLAERDGVERALLTIDNDGGSKRCPAHEPSHQEAEHAIDPADGCATCLLHSVTPDDWKPATGRSVIAVPIQIMESWLLWLSDPTFTKPETTYHRRILKKRFWGELQSSGDQRRIDFALGHLGKSGALDRLMERTSFVAFAEQAARWRGSVSA
jgi:hypothetical protein